MYRMKSHWPEQINPHSELRSAKRWLEMGLGQDRGGSLLRPDVYRMLAIVEAITILDNALDCLALESQNRDIERRARLKEADKGLEIVGG
jgi:hypothetical protein